MAATAVVIGDAMIDVHVAPSEPIRTGGDVPAVIRLAPGGQGANLAVRLARRGLAVRLACAIADDDGGRLLRDALGTDRVGVIPVDATATRTGIVVVLREPDAGRTMLSQRSALLEPLVRSPSAEPADLFGDDWLVVSGYVLLEPGTGLSAHGETPRRAVVGCSLSEREAKGWAAASRSLRPHLVIVNLDEARTLCGPGSEPAGLVPQVREVTGCATAVITFPDGAVATAEGSTIEVAAPASGPVVDTTGAGDAFAAGLVADLVDAGWPPPPDRLRRAMTAATAVASAVARTPGAQARVDGESRGAAT